MNKKIKMYLSLVLTLTLLIASVAWMVTVASQGEIVNYNRELIINTLDLDITIYEYNNETLQYEELLTPNIVINNAAPNDTFLYKIELTNNGNTKSSTSIVLSNIEGDIDALKNSLNFGSTSPQLKKFSMSESLETSSSNEKFIRLYEDVKIEPLETKTVYWYINIDSSASNEIAGKNLTIDSINFIKP